MTFPKFMELVEIRYKETGWRKGQTFFNVLNEIRPELADKMRSEEYMDPFYNDEALGNATWWVRQMWDNKNK